MMSNIWPDITYLFEAIRSIGRARSPKLRLHTARLRVDALRNAGQIATFLAAVQAQTLALTNINDENGRLLNAANGLAYAGVILDVIAALFSFLAAQQLSRTRDIIEDFHDYVAHCDQVAVNDLMRAAKQTWLSPNSSIIEAFLAHETLLALKARLRAENGRNASSDNTTLMTAGDAPNSPPVALSGRQSPPQRPTAIESTPSLLKDIYAISPYDSGWSATEILGRAGRAFEVFSIIGDASDIALVLGFICFMASIMCQAVGTQPPQVFISSAVALACFVILPIISGFWSNATSSDANRLYCTEQRSKISKA